MRTKKTNSKTLSPDLLRKLDAYWRAANHLSVGQLYPLREKLLSLAHIKPPLLNHWGTTPGLNFISVHLNRVIKKCALGIFTFPDSDRVVAEAAMSLSFFRCSK